MTYNNRSDSNSCPICGRSKKYWFPLCYECQERERQKPRCEICDKPVKEGFNLCTEHYYEKQEEKKKIKSIDYVKTKKEIEFKEKYEGKYYFNSQMVKSKSELLICYFLSANGLLFQYEPPMIINDREIRPDFVIDDQAGHTIILEHFGRDDTDYNKKRADKEREYYDLCDKEPTFYFVSTEEYDIFNLKERLGKKLNETPLKKVLWK
jgi:hypothetical protein